MKNKWRFIIFVAVITAVSAWQLHPSGGSPVYVTSLACRQCHQEDYNSWSNTLHPKMFRPVKNGSDILGACPRIGILFKIEAFQENKHRHIVNIPSIIFLK